MFPRMGLIQFFEMGLEHTDLEIQSLDQAVQSPKSSLDFFHHLWKVENEPWGCTGSLGGATEPVELAKILM